MTTVHRQLWQRLKSALSAHGVISAGLPTDIARAAQRVLGSDAVKRFVEDYYYGQEHDEGRSKLTHEQAERLVAEVEKLPGVAAAAPPGKPAAQPPAVSPKKAAEPGARTYVQTDLDEGVAFGGDEAEAARQRELAVRVEAQKAETARRLKEQEAEGARANELDLWLLRKFLDRGVFVHARMGADRFMISDGAMLEFRNAIPPVFLESAKLVSKAREISPDALKRSLPAVQEYRKDEHIVIATDVDHSDLHLRVITAKSGRKCRIDGEYLGYVRQRYRNSILYMCSEVKAILAEESGALVAAIMPMKS